jgi:hypothetical protein
MIEKNISVGNSSYPVEYPDRCPICHHYGDIGVRNTFLHPAQRGVEVVFQCPFPGCQSFFIGYYGPKGNKTLKGLKPQEPDLTHFPEIVADLSPQFIAIFKEAEQATQLGLTQVAGPGYRKAFEFLIKDYAKSLSPEKAGDIEKAFSGNVVRDYIPDPRIQAVAKRALWLGNDETHYLRTWASHDVDDLIKLIRLAIDWIEIERLSRTYTEGMPE